ncbi:HAMP domain-containing protein [Chloroflexia bacterium SDU3-3]|nr:HAMP domain-containing protein [Chloroflexia bacterium SDU3-3]
MRPPIFWTLLASFALVILIGICGMVGFVTLAASGVWQPAAVREQIGKNQRMYGEVLGDFYVANGKSWDGIEGRIDQFLVVKHGDYVIVDTSGNVVAGDSSIVPVVSGRRPGRNIAILAQGKQIGTLAFRMGKDQSELLQPQTTFRAVARSFVLAALLLLGFLLLLAVLLSRWLARPVRGVTSAALLVAGGQLDTQVAGARVRELDDLASAFNTMARSLSDADRQRRQLTADVAHELRTPLSIIKGRLEGVQDGIYQATPEQIGQLLDETALLERLIEDLRVLALAEAGQLPLYREPMDPTDLLAAARASFAAQAAERQIALSYEAADDLPLIDIDPQRMQQVLGNLLANALRHTPAGGSVGLRAELRGGGKGQPPSVAISVRDTGAGIAPDDLAHIFERFWRADQARTRGTGGTGLGLAIARQIVVAHGGDISAESERGAGTCLTITLPALAD